MTSLDFLYGTVAGRILLKPLVSRPVSKLSGVFLDSRLSKPLIKGFAKNNNIRVEDYEVDGITNFNQFFCRKIKAGLRPIDGDASHLISPCDGLLSAYAISNDLVLPVKQSAYTISSLLRDDSLAAEFDGGVCLVFRLCVNHYHRYVYAESGVKGENIFIPGVLHTVRPVALEKRPVFIENCREYTVIETENFGKMVQMEVGAMLVGRIVNNDGSKSVVRGEEKGRFEYGGSTIILLLKKDSVKIDQRFLDATAKAEEVDVKMGEVIGTRVQG